VESNPDRGVGVYCAALCSGLITHERSPTASRKDSLSKLILRGNWSDRLTS